MSIAAGDALIQIFFEGWTICNIMWQAGVLVVKIESRNTLGAIVRIIDVGSAVLNTSSNANFIGRVKVARTDKTFIGVCLKWGTVINGLSQANPILNVEFVFAD
jgi:hypothetical protein